MIKEKRKSDKMILGWQEWCALPELGLPALKIKLDTGAKTSALHAFDIETFEQGGIKYVRFTVHPLQFKQRYEKVCVAELIDERRVTSSSGHREKRYVIITPVVIGDKRWDIEVTLTKRDELAYRMLLGRQAMVGKVVVDPAKSFRKGKVTKKEARLLYKQK
ncbi:MAG: ATP-dependent zinc protease [Proteobacteria bacterium]|nr:ATP-dependent zinc protease [Pseudomonadota bacterium]